MLGFSSEKKMAITLKQSGAQSATFFISGLATGTITTASFSSAKAGQLKDFASTAFASNSAMVEAWAAIGGDYTISGSSTDGAVLTMTRNEDNTPVFGFAGLDNEVGFYAARIQTRYSASE
jgi:hypothetical protein